MAATRRLPKAQRRLVEAARDAGWRIANGSDGVKCYPPDGVSPPLSVHGSPKQNGHAHQNMVQAFKRHGVSA
jgi:hypothetical protein